MPTQLQRSKCRKALSRLCGEVIRDTVQLRLAEDCDTDLETLHQNISYGVMKILTEAYLGIDLNKEMIRDSPCLEIFQEADTGISTNAETGLVKFVRENSEYIAPEDLGGISELLSGHSLKLEDNKIVFQNNPQRRGAGRIYTPYDVTEYMCKTVLTKLMAPLESADDLIRLRILDPAVGSGAFLAQALRFIKAHSETIGIEIQDVHERVLVEQVLHGVDIDPFASKVCKLVMFIETGGRFLNLEPAVFTSDSLMLGGSPGYEEWAKHIGFEEKFSGYNLVIGNPPYVRIKPEHFEGFKLAQTRNLYGLFCELSLNLTTQDGIFSMIIPQAVMGARETKSLRERLLKEDARVVLQVFDSVPDFLFDQGKIESNSNTNINQRTTIVSLYKSTKKELNTSPLMRWRRREERDVLFDNLKQVKILESDIKNERIPMVSSSEQLTLLRTLTEISRTVGDIKSVEGQELFMTKAVRYFITALPRDLGRPNTLRFKVADTDFERVHVLLNSNVFYWWWRVFGNGFQVEQKDVDSFPLIQISQKIAKKYSISLIEAEEHCVVFKRNAGKDIPNINYNYNQELIQKIDAEIFKALRIKHNPAVFLSKTNSLFGKMNALVGYGGQNED